MKNRLKTYKNRTKTAKKPPYGRFGGFLDFQNWPVWQIKIIKIMENRLKTYKNRTKTAEKPPFWRFGGFSDFENP